MGTSILKRRILALNRVQTRMGSLGSQKTQPTLQGGVKAKGSVFQGEDFLAWHFYINNTIISAILPFFFLLHSFWTIFFYFILMMSIPVSVRLMWSPATAQSRASSCRVIPAEKPQDGSVTHQHIMSPLWHDDASLSYQKKTKKHCTIGHVYFKTANKPVRDIFREKKQISRNFSFAGNGSPFTVQVSLGGIASILSPVWI